MPCALGCCWWAAAQQLLRTTTMSMGCPTRAAVDILGGQVQRGLVTTELGTAARQVKPPPRVMTAVRRENLRWLRSIQDLDLRGSEPRVLGRRKPPADRARLQHEEHKAIQEQHRKDCFAGRIQPVDAAQ